MNYLKTALALELRRAWHSWRPWVALLLVAVLSAGLHIASKNQQQPMAQVGLTVPQGQGQDFFDRLNSLEHHAIAFVEADEDTLRKKIACGQWDCGLILDKDFDTRLRDGDHHQLVTIVTGPGSAIYPLVQEQVSAVLAELASPQIAKAYLISSGIANAETAVEAEPRLQQILPMAQRVSVQAESLDGTELQLPKLQEKSLERLFLGLLAALYLMWLLFTAVELGRRKSTALMRRMVPLQNQALLLLPSLLRELLLAFLIGALGLGIYWGKAGCSMLLPLAAYLVLLGGMALLLACSRELFQILPSLIPCLTLACLLFSPVLWDASLLVPQLKGLIRCLPLTLFMGACDGSLLDTGMMATGGFLCFWAAYTLAERPWRQSARQEGIHSATK